MSASHVITIIKGIFDTAKREEREEFLMIDLGLGRTIEANQIDTVVGSQLCWLTDTRSGEKWLVPFGNIHAVGYIPGEPT